MTRSRSVGNDLTEILAQNCSPIKNIFPEIKRKTIVKISLHNLRHPVKTSLNYRERISVVAARQPHHLLKPPMECWLCEWVFPELVQRTFFTQLFIYLLLSFNSNLNISFYIVLSTNTSSVNLSSTSQEAMATENVSENLNLSELYENLIVIGRIVLSDSGAKSLMNHFGMSF